MATPLVIGPEQEAALRHVRAIAVGNPVDMPALLRRLETPRGKRLHMGQMTRQSAWLPMGFMVTFSIETGHPVGTCRHMSMSSDAPGRAPTPEAVWMVAQHLGFVGGLNLCRVWMEKLQRGEGATDAVNVVQPVSVQPPHREDANGHGQG